MCGSRASAPTATGPGTYVDRRTGLLPTLAGPAGTGIYGRVVAGVLAAAVAAYLSVRFLTRYFVTRTLTPFGIYCLIAGIACIIRFA